MKKTNYKVIMESLKSEDVDMPTPNLDVKNLSIDEIKEIVLEQLKDVKPVADVEADQEDTPWHDAELEKQMDWMKKFNIKEVLGSNKE